MDNELEPGAGGAVWARVWGKNLKEWTTVEPDTVRVSEGTYHFPCSRFFIRTVTPRTRLARPGARRFRPTEAPCIATGSVESTHKVPTSH